MHWLHIFLVIGGLMMANIGMAESTKVWVADPQVRVSRDALPTSGGETVVRLTASRNGFASGQIAVRSECPLSGLAASVGWLKGPGAEKNGGPFITETNSQARFVGYVEVKALESSKLPAYGLVPDVLLEDSSIDVPANQTQPIWLTVRVPKDTEPGVYDGGVALRLKGEAEPFATVPVELTVDALTLPEPRDYAFYADFWQHPANIADQYGLPRWGEGHWTLLRAYARELARAGQKVITTTVIEDPWASQTRVPYPSLVDWRGAKDNETDNIIFHYDYAIFDRYVALCMAEGIDRAINAYSMVLGPGPRTDCAIAYTDAATGKKETLKMEVGDATYRAVWTQFLVDFKKHLKEKGWLDKTRMGFDEKPAPVMDPAIGLLREVAPEIHVALAGSWEPEHSERLSPLVQDFCFIFPGAPAEFAARRHAAGQVTTVYTCCGPLFPNTFAFSPLSEPRLLPWHAAAQGADGYLRWAWTCWPSEPLKSPDFGPWPSGDTFLVFPGKTGPLSSLRWEQFKQGVQDFELIAQARRRLAAKPDARLETALREALALAAREPDGRKKDPTDLPQARARLVEALTN